MTDANFYSTETVLGPRKRINHCIVCSKKKNLVFYSSDNRFIFQICVKCLDANCTTDEGVKG